MEELLLCLLSRGPGVLGDRLLTSAAVFVASDSVEWLSAWLSMPLLELVYHRVRELFPPRRVCHKSSFCIRLATPSTTFPMQHS